MPDHLVKRLITFAESGNQHKICCQTLSGKPIEYQGWIMEISDNALLISIGSGDKNGKDIWILFEQLKNAQLFYWDPKSNEWQEFSLND